MDDATLKKFIADWFWKARQENRPEQTVSKFMFLWICFNARLAYESNGYTDAEMIGWLKAARPEASALRAGFNRLAENDEFQTNLRNLIALGPIPTAARTRSGSLTSSSQTRGTSRTLSTASTR